MKTLTCKIIWMCRGRKCLVLQVYLFMTAIRETATEHASVRVYCTSHWVAFTNFCLWRHSILSPENLTKSWMSRHLLHMCSVCVYKYFEYLLFAVSQLCFPLALSKLCCQSTHPHSCINSTKYRYTRKRRKPSFCSTMFHSLPNFLWNWIRIFALLQALPVCCPGRSARILCIMQ